MDKVIGLRRAIKTQLSAVHPRVYFQVADEKAAFPYLVFDFPNSFDDGAMENFVLDVDGWDAPTDGDTTAIESLMAAADAVLHREVVRLPGMALVIYRENRLSLRDDDKRIRRRQYVYQVRTFGGG